MKCRFYRIVLTLVTLPCLAQQQFAGVRPKLLNITTAGVTVVKGSAGTIHSVTVNSPGGAQCIAVLWDSASTSQPISGTRLAGIDCSSGKVNSYESDTVNGIVIDTSGDSPAPDLTVSYN